MDSASQGEHSQPRLLFVAAVLGFIAALVTAAAVSWSTPDGNLVVTLVPALAVGLTAFALALWRFRRGESSWQTWRSVKDLWRKITRSVL